MIEKGKKKKKIIQKEMKIFNEKDIIKKKTFDEKSKKEKKKNRI